MREVASPGPSKVEVLLLEGQVHSFFWQRIVYRCRRCERGSPSSCPPAASSLSSGRRSPSSTSCRASAAWRRRSQWISARVSSRRREYEKVEAQQSVPQRQGTWPQLPPLSVGEARWAPMRLCRRALSRLHRWPALVELMQLEPKWPQKNDDDALICAVAHAHAHAHDVDSCSLYCHVVIIVVVRSRLSWSCVLSVLLVVLKWLGSYVHICPLLSRDQTRQHRSSRSVWESSSDVPFDSVVLSSLSPSRDWTVSIDSHMQEDWDISWTSSYLETMYLTCSNSFKLKSESKNWQ